MILRSDNGCHSAVLRKLQDHRPAKEFIKTLYPAVYHYVNPHENIVLNTRK